MQRQMLVKTSSEGTCERLEIGAPGCGVPSGFEVEVKQPGPAVRPLEPAAQRTIEIGALRLYLLRGEAIVRDANDRVGFGNIGKQAPQRQQRPPSVDAAVPIEAAEEDRMQHSRRLRVRVAFQHMIELVRIFSGDVAERD